MIRPLRSPRGPLLALAVLLPLLLPAAPLGDATADDGSPVPSLTVLGARIQPLNDKAKPWDADHGAIPRFVYVLLGGISGFPPLSALALVPYRNRPDPYVVVRAGEAEEEIARTPTVQGSFLPMWRLAVPLDAKALAAPTLTLEAFDDDLKDDDVLGRVVVETEKLLAKPGVHALEGTRGLYDLTVVVHRPDLGGEVEPSSVVVDAVTVEVRERRPEGGDWDAGGNPLRGRLPRRLPLPEKLEGLPEMRPDLIVHLVATSGEARTSTVAKDTFEHAWEGGDLVTVTGRPGVGDGLFVDVVDEDLAVSDPVGVLFVPFEDLLERKEGGTLEVEGDDHNGIERVVLRLR